MEKFFQNCIQTRLIFPIVQMNVENIQLFYVSIQKKYHSKELIIISIGIQLHACGLCGEVWQTELGCE